MSKGLNLTRREEKILRRIFFREFAYNRPVKSWKGVLVIAAVLLAYGFLLYMFAVSETIAVPESVVSFARVFAKILLPLVIIIVTVRAFFARHGDVGDEAQEGVQPMGEPATDGEARNPSGAVRRDDGVGTKLRVLTRPIDLSVDTAPAASSVELKPGTLVVVLNRHEAPYGEEAVIIDSYARDDLGLLEVELVDFPNKLRFLLDSSDVRPLAQPEKLLDLPEPSGLLLVQAVEVFASIDDELILHFAEHPEALDAIHPEQFEDLIGAIYRNHGFSVERLGRWNQADGGVDLLAVRNDLPSGMLTLAIQCKHSKHKVSADPIRSLAGVIDRFQAHKGVLATTSSFTKRAIDESRRFFWRIELEDRKRIIDKITALYNDPE